MKKHFALISVLSFLLLIGGCVRAAHRPKMTQLQLREMQTKTYEAPRKIVMEAALGFLQDNAYLIKNADADLGIIHATKEVDVESAWESFFASVFSRSDARWQKNKVHEISVNVREFGRSSKVRVISQVKLFDNKGGVVQVAQVTSPEFYKDVFSSIDKGIFLQKEGL